MSIIKIKAKISEKNRKERLTDEKLSDTTGGARCLKPKGYAQIAMCKKDPNAQQMASFWGYNRPDYAFKLPAGANSGDGRDQRLGRLIGYCADCKCPVYSVTRKNHAGHNVITGAGR